MKAQGVMYARMARWATRWGARARLLALVALVVGVAASMVGCAGAGVSTRTAATPSATATPAPQTLYQADWAARPNEWKLPAHWSIANGQLVNDGQSAKVLAVSIPYVVTAQRYTLHLDIRALAANGPGVNNMYGVLGQTPEGKLLFTAEASEVEHTLHSYAIVYPSLPDPNSNNTFGTADFTPGRSSRPYVVQVNDKELSFTTGGGLIGDVLSAQSLSPARLILVDQNVQLVVESLTITTP